VEVAVGGKSPDALNVEEIRCGFGGATIGAVALTAARTSSRSALKAFGDVVQRQREGGRRRETGSA
jgi:hypothetical protein